MYNVCLFHTVKTAAMFWEALVLFIISGLLYFLVAHRWTKAKRFPPGPRQLPLIGNLLDMKNFNHLTMRALAKKYGDIYMISIMGQKVFIVTDIDLAWEALIRKGNIFAGRKKSYVSSTLFSEAEAIIFGDFGARWKLLRKVTHSALRMFGSGIQNLEQKVQREVNETCLHLSESQGVLIDPHKLISLGVTNIICSCIFGTRYAEGDEKLREVDKIREDTLRLVGSASLLEVFPFMKLLPLKIHKRLADGRDLMDRVFMPKLQEHKQTYREGTIRDITDALIKALNDAEKEDSKAKGILNDAYLKNTLADLVIAGADTTTDYLTWSLLYLAAFPEVQAKIHQELDDVIGRDRQPRLKDKSSLPYLEATMTEIMRHSSFVYTTLPHHAQSDTTLGGYDIPENSQVIIDLRAIHHNPKHWKDPETFDPTRFLDGEQSFICPATFSFIPFGAGPRGCLGQSLAKIEIFLFLAGLLQQFRFEWPPGSSHPDLEPPVDPIVRGVLEPSPYKLCVTRRD